MLKVTVDTNVIISALLKKDSVPAKVVSHILNECQLCIRTGDNHLIQLGIYKGIQIISPSEFLTVLQNGK